MAGVVGWGPEGGSRGPSDMARAYHEAPGVSFQSAEHQKYMDAPLYGLTLVWGTEVTSFNVTPDAVAVSLAICDLVSKDPVRFGGLKYAGVQHGGRSAPKKAPEAKKVSRMAVDVERKGDQVPMGTAPGDGVGEEDDVRPEMTHKEPSYKNARWPRK